MGPKPGETPEDADRSFERLYEGYRGEVYRAALRELGNPADAEDVTQSAFVDAYRALLRGSQPRAPRAWLLAIAENVRRRRFRTALHRPREEPLDVHAAASAEPSDERADAVRSALVALPPQQRAVFLLREIAGLSYDEIAERLDSTVASVQMMLFRARRTLRAELEPPAVPKRGRTLGLQLPPWLAHLVGRGDPLALTPRGAGALGAAVLALGGVTAGGTQLPGDDPRTAAVVGEQHRALPLAVPLVPVAAARQRPVHAGAESKAAPASPAAPTHPALAAPTTPPEPVPAPPPPVSVSVPAAEPAVETATAPVNVPVTAPRRGVSPALPVVEQPAPALPVLPPVVPALPPVVPALPPVVPPVLPELPELPAIVDPLEATVPLETVPLELAPLPPPPLR